MARAGFYNENEYRDYPFLTQVKPLAFLVGDDPDLSSSSSSESSASSESAAAVDDLPHEAVVDFGAIMGLDARFNEDKHWVYLYRITRQDPYFIYEFRTNAPGAAGESLVFVRNFNTDPIHTQQWTQSRLIGLPDPLPGSESSFSAISSFSSSEPEPSPFCEGSSASAADCGGPGCDEPAWEGFLITGPYADLSELLSDGASMFFDSRLWVIEPARTQNLSKSFARSLNLANVDRTHVTLPEICSSSSATDEDIYANAVCLQGELRFKEGYNCTIRQEDDRNSLLIAATVNGGEGAPCEEIKLYPTEVPPAGSKLLTGGPTCGEIVKAINGKSARNLRIEAGPGFQITTDTQNPSKLIVDATLEDFALCQDPESSSAGDC